MTMIPCKICFCVFIFLLTAKFIKIRHIYARIYFIFLEHVLTQTWNSFNTKFEPD